VYKDTLSIETFEIFFIHIYPKSLFDSSASPTSVSKSWLTFFLLLLVSWELSQKISILYIIYRLMSLDICKVYEYISTYLVCIFCVTSDFQFSLFLCI
jgi:hypothetical protein